jgi:mono/diheme cytochrome c family protein
MCDCDRLAVLLPLTLMLACSPPEPTSEADADAPSPRGSTVTARSDPPAAPAPPSRQELVAQGRSIYMGNCTACHNMNPSQDGSLGPAITGASRELLESRVLHNTYPEGYTPKRTTTLMVALPHLADDIDALTAFLDQ